MVKDVINKYIFWIIINIAILLFNKFTIENIICVFIMLGIELFIVFSFSRSSNKKKR